MAFEEQQADPEGWPAPEERHDKRETMLFGTEQLNREEAERLLARVPARLIVWMGEAGSGKTTLCTELYEAQRQRTADACFAGSWTLLAFEQLAHRRRSGGSPADATQSRATAEGRDILHLALSAGGAEPLHLLLVDLDGDHFRRLADNHVVPGDVPWLEQADKLVLLVDGARLCDRAARSSALTRIRQLLERLQAAELPRPKTRLALVATKWDLVEADPAAAAYWAPREAELVEELRVIDRGAPALHLAAGDVRGWDRFAELRAWLLDVATDRYDLPPTGWDRYGAPGQGAPGAPPPAPIGVPDARAGWETGEGSVPAAPAPSATREAEARLQWPGDAPSPMARRLPWRRQR